MSVHASPQCERPLLAAGPGLNVEPLAFRHVLEEVLDVRDQVLAQIT
jgi:hypothetical protein